ISLARRLAPRLISGKILDFHFPAGASRAGGRGGFGAGRFGRVAGTGRDPLPHRDSDAAGSDDGKGGPDFRRLTARGRTGRLVREAKHVRRRRFSFWPLLVLPALAGCDAKPATIEHYPLSAETLALPADVQKSIGSALESNFGTPSTPKVPKTTVVGMDHLPAGADNYRRLCLHCHGFTGDGAGPTAPFLTPRPRDYRLGKFKFTSTAPGEKPVRDDILHTLKAGVMYTAMPSFALLDGPTLESLVDYVLFLSIRGNYEKMLVKEYIDQSEIAGDSLSADIDVIGGWRQNARDKGVKSRARRP